LTLTLTFALLGSDQSLEKRVIIEIRLT